MTNKKDEKKGSRYERNESIFQWILIVSSVILLLILIGIFVTLPLNSMDSIKEFGLGFVFSTDWSPQKELFGALPFIVGTLLTSFIALLFSIPFAISIALFLGEYFTHGIISTILKSAVELLAGIPSIIYGFWGIFVLVPVIRMLQIKLGIAPYGVGIFTSAVILTIMIIPYSASIGREVIQLVPNDYKEAAYSMGATRYEVIRQVILPIARSGVLAGVILSLGRALGETMAVTMLIGNVNKLPDFSFAVPEGFSLFSFKSYVILFDNILKGFLDGIFAPSNTMASIIANEFTETTTDLQLSSIVEIGLVLFIMTLIINLIGRYIIKKTSVM
jgi:phosphate transport system permease protein